MPTAFEFENVHVVVSALVIFVAIMYWHGREPGERQRRGDILIGVLVILIGYFKPANYNWIHWVGHVGGFVVISLLIAWFAKGSRP